MPFADGFFDMVTCQFGLMFFNDRHQALQEMGRVLRPGGRVSIAVWDSLERTPGYTVCGGGFLSVAQQCGVNLSFAGS